MSIKFNKKLADEFRKYSSALNNVKNDEQLKSIMASVGYDEEKIALGNTLLEDAKSKMELSLTNYNLFRDAERGFIKKRKELLSFFTVDRNKLKIIFRNDSSVIGKLSLLGSLPSRFSVWIAMATSFYDALNASEGLKAEAAVVGISQQRIDRGINRTKAVKAADDEKYNIKAKSEDSTQSQREAVKQLKDWMKNFFAMAKLALKSRPQLFEAFRKVVKK
jgi:hypothetical protein